MRGHAGARVQYSAKIVFERKKIDEFQIEALDLGELTRVRIGHDNSGSSAAWFLDKVVITDPRDTKHPIVFPCDRWLARDEDDGQIQRDLLPTGKGSAFSSIPYKLSIRTGDRIGAGTDANVSCILHGKKGESGRITLDNDKNNFERARVDVFTVECDELGLLEAITIGHDNAGAAPGWYCEWIEIDCPTLGKRYKATVNQWFAKGEGDGLVERKISFDDALAIDQKNVWLCTVKTSDVKGGGTDADVYIRVYGDKVCVLLLFLSSFIFILPYFMRYLG